MTPVPIGYLYPGHSAEDDYPRMAEMVRADIEPVVVHTSVGEDAHRVDALLDLGGTKRLLEGAAQLKAHNVQAAMWSCTSGSFVFGWDGARKQVDEIADFLGVPASSTSLAFVEAIHAIGAKHVAIAATYPDDVARRFADFLGKAGIEVLSIQSEDIITAAEVGRFGRERVFSFVAAGDHPDADAVLVPDTALHTAEWLEGLEAHLGKPVLSANQVTMRESLRLVGLLQPQDGFGTLFRAA